MQLVHTQLARRRGLGFTYSGGDYFDDYLQNYDWDYWGGTNEFYGSGYAEEINPYIDRSAFDSAPTSSDWSDSWWFDDSTGLYFDDLGGAWDVFGQYDQTLSPIYDFGDDLLFSINTTDTPLETLPPEYAALPEPQSDWDYILNLYDSGIDAPLPPALTQTYWEPAPVVGTVSKKKEWLKKALEAAKRKAAALQQAGSGSRPSSSGGTGGAKPSSSAQPQQCPAGYVRNPKTGQCVKVQPQSAAQAALKNDSNSFLSNPLYLLLGAILIAVVAKK